MDFASLPHDHMIMIIIIIVVIIIIIIIIIIIVMHFASLPHDRWIQRLLKSTPGGRYAAGCPRHNWVTKISAFVRFLQVDDWQKLAQDMPVWLHLT